jgi:hypothetical protein
MKVLMLALCLTLAAAPANAQSIDGDWHGTLVAGATELRLVLHVIPDAKGGFTATLDSPDQGVKGIAVASVSLADSTLKFDVPQIRGTYEGKVDAKATAITGTWSQFGMSAPLNLSRPKTSATVTRVPKPSEIDGDWEGTLEAGGTTLRLVLHVLTFEDGIAATMDSPDQNALGLPVSSITRNGTALQFEMKQLAGSFSGTLDANLTTIDGTWSQLGNGLPLRLKRVRRTP